MTHHRLTRAVIVLGLMLAATVLSVVAVPNDRLADTRVAFILESAVPKAFGDWRLDRSLVPIPPSPDQAAALNRLYDQILSRTYINSRGERVMLSITYGSRQNQQLRAHRQEVCYRAQGFDVSRLERVPLTLAGVQISSTRMVATQGPRVEPVTYWFTIGDRVVLTYFEREWAQFRYALSGYIPDGYLVRVSSLSIETEAAFRRHIEFADVLLDHLDSDLRNRLIGHS
jgi:EpsI family protein